MLIPLFVHHFFVPIRPSCHTTGAIASETEDTKRFIVSNFDNPLDAAIGIDAGTRHNRTTAARLHSFTKMGGGVRGDSAGGKPNTAILGDQHIRRGRPDLWQQSLCRTRGSLCFRTIDDRL